MATFIWPPEVQWPPPAHILLNYDVVAPDGAVLSLSRASEEEEKRMQPFLALITPLSGHPDQGLPGSPPGYWGGVAPPYPDQGLPGQPPRPAHPIAPGGRPPGYWGGVAPPHPDQGLPGQPPGYWGGVAPPQPEHPIAPGGQPPGYWGGVAPPYPDQGLPGGQGGAPTHPIYLPGAPDQGLPPTGGEPIPPDQIEGPQVPDEYADDVVVGVKKPGSDQWTYTAYTVQPDQGQPAPAPHRR